MAESFRAALESHLRAKTPVIFVSTSEPERARNDILSLCAELRASPDGSASSPALVDYTYKWSCTVGMEQVTPAVRTDSNAKPALTDPVGFLTEVLTQATKPAQDKSSVYVATSMHHYMNVPLVQQIILDATEKFPLKPRSACSRLIFIHPEGVPPPPLHQRQVATLDYSLPTTDELVALLNNIVEEKRRMGARELTTPTDAASIRKAAEAGVGLSKTEFDSATARSLIRCGGFDLRFIADEKRSIVRRSGLLDFVEVKSNLNDIGGLEYVKEWLAARENSFSPEARAYGLPAPKGVLFLGVPGAGKSAAVQAIGGSWNLPVLRLDMGRVMGSLVGQSEGNMRTIISVAEAVAPVILWLDELEKGIQSGGGNDSGTSSRVLGTFLTWLSEKTSPVFIAATANDVSAVPPELLRKGRLDEIFFVDLPTEVARKEIARIHIRKSRRNPDHYDLDAIAMASNGYSGAEIEQCIVSAMYRGFSSRREYTTADILTELQETRPMSETATAQFEAQREKAKSRARQASFAEVRRNVSSSRFSD